MRVIALERAFAYNGVALPDVDPKMSPEEVKIFYASTMYPELANAVTEGPDDSNGKLRYSFRKAVGTKG
jgi:PRTRC genetic system protein C